jgi:hypothetical protein
MQIQTVIVYYYKRDPRTGGIKAHIVLPMKTFTYSYEVTIFKRTSLNSVWGVRQFKTAWKNMKRLQINFFSQFLAIYLLMQTLVKSKKTCKPGQEDVTSQPFDLTARGECDVFVHISWDTRELAF